MNSWRITSPPSGTGTPPSRSASSYRGFEGCLPPRNSGSSQAASNASTSRSLCQTMVETSITLRQRRFSVECKTRPVHPSLPVSGSSGRSTYRGGWCSTQALRRTPSSSVAQAPGYRFGRQDPKLAIPQLRRSRVDTVPSGLMTSIRVVWFRLGPSRSTTNQAKRPSGRWNTDRKSRGEALSVSGSPPPRETRRTKAGSGVTLRVVGSSRGKLR